jgi:ribose transport system permease protein
LAAFIRDYSILTVLVIAIIVLGIVEPAFLTVRNLRNLLDQNAGIGAIACGMTFAIIAGGFDLSVAAIFAVSGIVAAMVANVLGPVPGLMAGLAAGLALGIANGLLIARLRLNSFLTTLASSIVMRGIGIALSGGFLITVTDPVFGVLGRGTIYGVTYSGLVFVLFAILCALLLHNTQFGRYVYAVGGNEEAARLSGIRTGLIKGVTFVLTGFSASLAGIIATSKVSSAIPNAGGGLELQAIAAVVLGGTSISGGSGAIWRTIIGVFLLAVINNAFNIMNLEPYLRDIVTGSIIILAVIINTLTGKK